MSGQPIVIDNGTQNCRVGFAGAELPKLQFGACVGRPKHDRVMADAVEGDEFVGQRCEELRGLLRLHYCTRRGVVEDWADLQRVWQHGLDALEAQHGEHAVLVTEAALNPRSNRQKAAETLFESFQAPAAYFQVQDVLALYASGKTTGCVLQCGAGTTSVVPVYEGFALTHAIGRTDIAGWDVTDRLAELVRRSPVGLHLHTSSEREVARQMKETVCFVSQDPRHHEGKDRGASSSSSLSSSSSSSSSSSVPSFDDDRPYTLPDKRVVRVGHEQHRAPEILFQPHLIGSEYDGVHDVLRTAIEKADMTLQPALYNSIVLSGGSTLLQGFGHRLLRELKQQVPKDVPIKIFAPPDRTTSAWVGGSILASLSTFRRMWTSREEWEEHGAAGLYRKSL